MECVSGPVTNYTILVQDDQDGGFNVLANLPATQTNFTDSSSTFSDGIQYEIQADYAGGASAITGEDDPTVNPEYTVQTAIVRGPQGGLYLVASTIPQNVVAIRVYWGGGYTGYPDLHTEITFHQVDIRRPSITATITAQSTRALILMSPFLISAMAFTKFQQVKRLYLAIIFLLPKPSRLMVSLGV